MELRLPCAGRPLEVLAPGPEDRRTVDFTKTCRYAYRGTGQPLAMPAVVVFRPDETIVARTLRVQDRHTECADYVDWGLTLFADFTLPTRGFETSFQDKTPAISARRVHLRLEPGKPVTVSLLLFGHEGDWRPGLGHLVERYPDFFVVADPRAPNLHGAFMCSGGFKPDTEIATDQVLAEWKRQHVQTVEVHGTFPFYGRYLPPAERWTTLADDRWHLLRKEADPQRPADDAPWKAIYDYVAKKSPPAMTVAAVRDYINRLHGHGMHALVYFNPTEAWKLWIKANYPGDLVLNDKGRHVPEWYESLLVCPNPDSPWGQYLLDTFKRMMDLYPEADGFFMDQSTYDRLDYAHDNGWSIQDGRTAYRMGWAIDQFSQRCRAMAKARGKFLWWNGPYISDIAYYAEGMMAEAGDEKEVHTIQYLMMGGRACCTLSRTGETTLQDCAAYGIYPTVMEGPAAQLASRYWPIFELFRGKRWVFNAHALDLPQGTKGNLWRLPDGNALVERGDGRPNGQWQVIRREPACDGAFARCGGVPRGLFPLAGSAGQAAVGRRPRRRHVAREHPAASKRLGHPSGQDGRASELGRSRGCRRGAGHRRGRRVGQLDRPRRRWQVDVAGRDRRAARCAGRTVRGAHFIIRLLKNEAAFARPSPVGPTCPERPSGAISSSISTNMNVIDIPFHQCRPAKQPLRARRTSGSAAA